MHLIFLVCIGPHLAIRALKCHPWNVRSLIYSLPVSDALQDAMISKVEFLEPEARILLCQILNKNGFSLIYMSAEVQWCVMLIFLR